MKVDVLGVSIDALPRMQILDNIEAAISRGQKLFLTTPYSELILAAQEDREFRNILNSASIALPDGVGILWAAHFEKIKSQKSKIKIIWQAIFTLVAIILNPKSIRDPIPERISGSTFIWDLAAMADRKDYSVFLLGGFEDTPGLAAAALKHKFPNLKIAGTYAGAPGEQGIVDKINRSRADFLFVAFGPVRQEKWIYENREKLTVKLAIGLGGTFDYIAGKRLLAPQIWANTGLEWLWRLVTQPWRVGRILRGVFGLIYYTVKSRL